MIIGSVALPVWNSKKIAWICMESLCRQLKPNGSWELIVFEEKQNNQLGKDFFMSYKDRLSILGCERIEYKSSVEKVPLSKKWVQIAWETSLSSKYYCFCAADNYYSPHLLQDAEKNIQSVDWLVVPKGYFYDFKYNKIILYSCGGPFGLQMTAKTDLVRKLPLVNLKRGIDGWVSKNLHYKVCLQDKSDHWKSILCTNGLNNISTYRHMYFTRQRRPFYATDEILTNIVPEDISKRIIELHNELKIKK